MCYKPWTKRFVWESSKKSVPKSDRWDSKTSFFVEVKPRRSLFNFGGLIIIFLLIKQKQSHSYLKGNSLKLIKSHNFDTMPNVETFKKT